MKKNIKHIEGTNIFSPFYILEGVTEGTKEGSNLLEIGENKSKKRAIKGKRKKEERVKPRYSLAKTR